MILLQPAALAQPVAAPRAGPVFNTTWLWSPRIQVSIQPLLHYALQHDSPHTLTAPVAPQAMVLAGRSAGESAIGAQAAPALPAADGRAHVVEAAPPAVWPSPLARIFARARPPGEGEPDVAAPTSWKIARQVARRVTEEHQRQEQRVKPASASLGRGVPRADAQAQAAAGAVAQRALASLGVRPGIVGPPQAPPAGLGLDIERLTDQVVRQIDQRIVAHRERMGRVF
jgi:hypothetical protein